MRAVRERRDKTVDPASEDGPSPARHPRRAEAASTVPLWAMLDGPSVDHAAGSSSATLLRSGCDCAGGCECSPALKASPLVGTMVSEPGDPAERRADARAGSVLARMPLRGATGSAATASSPALPTSAPPAVSRLASRGQPLSGDERAYFEPRFGTDLHHVRVHTYPEAAELAKDADARAFTIGSHVFFGPGQYNTSGAGGRALLAHELAHTEQDDGAGGLLRTPVCRDLLDIGSTRTSDPIPGNRAHTLITQRFIDDVGPFQRFSIPAAARAPFDTEGCSSDSAPSEINPLIYDPRPRTRRGMGIPDIMLRRGNRVEIAEIKPATWGCVTFGENQVQNYVDKGNADPELRRRRVVKDFSVMPPSSWNALPDRVVVGNVDLLYNWCGQGLIGYLGVQRDDMDTLVCGASDQGRIDRFVDGLMDRGRALIDRVVNNAINSRLTGLIDQLSLQDMLTRVFGEAAAGLADRLDSALRRQLELELRAGLHRLKDQIVERVIRELRRQLRTMISEIVTALCATAQVLSAAKVLEELRKRLQAMALTTAVAVATVMIGEAIAALMGKIADVVTENIWVIIGLVVIAICAVLIALLIADDATLIGVVDDVLIAPLLAAIRWGMMQLAPLSRVLAPAF